MCLLIVVAGCHDQLPLVVGANRDELLDRPAIPMTVLREHGPRTLGGRDELAGGTWLAVNEHGVVAGLTNRPATAGRDPSKRSRGELPLALTEHASAAQAVEAFAAAFDPDDYNPSWLLVGDRDALFAVDMTEGPRPRIDRLAPGVHVLENRAPGTPSAKVARVRDLLAGAERDSAGGLVDRLRGVLADHEVPPPEPGDPPDSDQRPGAIRAACVHTDRYGTRWSGIVGVSTDRAMPPAVLYADGQPCTTPYVDPGLWAPRQEPVVRD